jgi:hypothetical protein
MAVFVPVCRSTLSMQWGHNAAALGLPHVWGARVVGESPLRYYFLYEGVATGQSHPRRAPPPPSAGAHAAPRPCTPHPGVRDLCPIRRSLSWRSRFVS